MASASIAQVHFAALIDAKGESHEVAVKVIRPLMKEVIEKDLALMRTMAGWLDRLSVDGRRLKPKLVVAEFDKYCTMSSTWCAKRPTPRSCGEICKVSIWC